MRGFSPEDIQRLEINGIYIEPASQMVRAEKFAFCGKTVFMKVPPIRIVEEIN